MCVCVYMCGIYVREHVQAFTQCIPHVRSHRSGQNRKRAKVPALVWQTFWVGETIPKQLQQ